MMMIARAIFHDDGEITIQAGEYSCRFGYILEAIDRYWDYLVEGMDDEDVSSAWFGFEKNTIPVLSTDFVINAGNLGMNPMVCPNYFARLFLEGISEKYETENKAQEDDGWWVVDKNNPFLRRWHENNDSALNDPGIAAGTHRIESC